MKANNNQIRTAINTPGGDVRLYLLHGPDEAGASELAATLARTMGPECERIDLDPSLLKSSPGRLAEEAASLSLFGGQRLIRINGAGDECSDAVALLLAASNAGSPAVLIGPGLKANSKLVKLVQGDPRAMSYACYVPEGPEAERLAVSIAREHGLRAIGDAALRVASASGGDRAVMARELEKIALYLDAAPDRPRELDDAALDAIGADLGDAEISRAIDAAIDGRADAVGREMARLEESGVSPIPVLRQMVRRLMTLAELRAEIDAGAGIAQVTERVFFREKAITARALRHWRGETLAAAIDRIRIAERATMGSANAGIVLAQSALLAVARMAARQR